MLLTPPDQVAVQRADGTWYRRSRERGDPPPAYTALWYYRYLRQHGLPYFFLTEAHVAMLRDPVESQFLGLADDLPPPREPPAAGFLQRRYPNAVQHLLPGVLDATQTYTAALDVDLIQRIVRRFPAVLANATTFDDYRVYVLPSGHIEIRYGREHNVRTEREVEQARLPWLPETSGSYLASYVLENEREFVPPAPTVQDRTQDRLAVQQDGGLVDMDEQPAGVGSLEWFDAAVDAVRARNLGLDSPQDVLQARANGALTNVPVHQRPWTIWWPERRLLNPPTQPQGAGQWQYYTAESECFAWTNLGGQDAFPTIQQPTALDIYTRRMYVGARGEPDDIAGVDIVWVPAVPTAPTRPPPTRPPPARPPPRKSSTNARTSTTPGTNNIVDADSGLTHRPNNPGGSDQEGVPGERKYQTLRINGKLFTVDRSRAHADNEQEWKSWSIGKGGKWYQWRHYAHLDWKDPDEVEKMNKWREQSLARIGFPRKRKDDRKDYTQAERDWVFEYVKAAKGERPEGITKEELTRRFNQRFGSGREMLGVVSLYDRLRDEYNRNNGQQRQHRPRGASRRSSQPQPEPEPSDDEETGGYDSQYGDDDEEL